MYKEFSKRSVKISQRTSEPDSTYIEDLEGVNNGYEAESRRKYNLISMKCSGISIQAYINNDNIINETI